MLAVCGHTPSSGVGTGRKPEGGHCGDEAHDPWYGDRTRGSRVPIRCSTSADEKGAALEPRLIFGSASRLIHI